MWVKMPTIAIPFPLWDGVFTVNKILRKLQESGYTAGMSKYELPRLITPRRFKWTEVIEASGDSVIKATFWGGGRGYYITVVLRGAWGSNWTFWEMESMKVRFEPSIDNFGNLDKVNLALNKEQIQILDGWQSDQTIDEVCQDVLQPLKAAIDKVKNRLVAG